MKPILTLLLASLVGLSAQTPPPSPTPDTRKVKLPMERNAYFVGESVLLNAVGEPGQTSVKVELTDAEGKAFILYEGAPGSFVLDTTKLAPGAYTLDGFPFYLTASVRSSVASLQDEAAPRLALPASKKISAADAKKAAQVTKNHILSVQESGLTAVMGMMESRYQDPGQLNAFSKEGLLYFNNPEGRPTSFVPVKEDPVERVGMSQRMLQSAQQHGQYPNFSGFVYGFDTTGFAPGGRKMLLIYWGWRGQEENLRKYLERQDELVAAEFKKQTGMEWVQSKEFLAYALAQGRSDLAPVIDLATVRWVEAMTPKMKPFPESEKVVFEKRLDAWSAYLMTIYEKNYAFFQESIRGFDSTFQNTASVQIDHAPARFGQYFASANRPLDFRYQSTWNDQIDHPDYLFQPLFTGAVLNMNRPEEKRVWISAALGPIHEQANYAGKLTRAAAHNLANGVSGLGFALEGFSSLFSMNNFGGWPGARGKAIGFDATSGKEFLDRFAWLAVEGRGDYGAGVLFSKSQLGRQDVTQGFGTPQYNSFITLARLGYTPVYLTEEEIAAKQFRGVKSIVIPGQVVPLPENVLAGLREFVAQGGKVVTDKATLTDVAATETMDFTMPMRIEPGKSHNYQAPGQSPNKLWPGMYAEYGPAFEKAVGGVGHAVLKPANGVKSDVTLSQIKGGTDALYVVAVNDSMVKSQADWRQVKESLVPNEGMTGFLYDLTEEKALGQITTFESDLSETTARVYGILPRELGSPEIKATQKISAGEAMGISVGFLDKAGKPLAGVLPFHLTLKQPDGKAYFAGYRGTDAMGKFSVSLNVPVNVPMGQWTVEVRSQLDGSVTTLPVTVAAGRANQLASQLKESVLVREKALIEQTLTKGQTIWLPLFGPQVTELAEAAKQIQKALAAKGVAVKILENPEMVEYALAYDPTPEQVAQNERVDKGEVIGKVKSYSVIGNDWFGSNGIQSRYPILLLKTAGAVNPIVGALGGQLWPKVAEVEPTIAVIQGVAWAFGSAQANAIVIDAKDAAGIATAVGRLTKLPDDFLTQSVRSTRARLLSEFHLGGSPAGAPEKGLTQTGLAAGKPAPQPFRISFGEARPLAPGEEPAKSGNPEPPLAVPGFAITKKLYPMVRYKDSFVQASHPRAWSEDMRFSDATDLEIELPQAGPVEIGVDGIFRYSDRRPATQPQWEDYLVLWDQYLKGPRQPAQFEVWVDGKPVGKLDKVTEEKKTVDLNISMGSTGEGSKKAEEEVATTISGVLDLPAGKHRLRLVHSHIVDGKLKRVRVGVTRESVEAAEKQAAEEATAKKAAEEAAKKAEVELKKKQAEVAKKTKTDAAAASKPKVP